MTCPTCGTAVKWTAGNELRPFCSERCKLIDLGSWADDSDLAHLDVEVQRLHRIYLDLAGKANARQAEQ